jgi:acyl-CoA synthetase (AMP-forming)/AMP-acid ligase II
MAPPEMQTVPGLLAQRAAEDGDLSALVTESGRITWRDLDGQSARLATHFVAAGLGKGSRVGLLMPNSIGWAIVAMAASRIGAVLVPLSTLLRPPELEQQLRIAAVTHLVLVDGFRQRDYLADLAQIVPSFRPEEVEVARHAALPSLLKVWRWDALAMILNEEPAVAVRAMAAALEHRVVPADDLAIVFTSGSRGLPKGVIHTHGNALRATAAGLGARCVRPRDRLYIPMPFFWVGGYGTGLLSALIAGCTLLTEAAPAPEQTLRFIAREKATLFRGWPDQAARIAAHPSFATTDLSSLRAGSLNPVLPPQQRAKPGARANLFGMTETFGPSFGYALDTDMPDGKWGSTGRAFEGIEARVADTAGEALPAGETGRLLVRGPNVMRGICGRSRESVFTADGWYDTGDLARIDADGFVFYMGRSDDMFKVRGATVYPTEVEEALQKIPGVRRAFATDLRTESGEAEVAVALVVDDPAALPLDRIAGQARALLSAFKLPSVWLALARMDDVPTTATGKVDKVALQQKLRAEGIRPSR